MPLRDKSKKRYSGILLAISSLPSKYGIGDFGEGAYSFVDFLKQGRQRFWQILPLNFLGEGNSPYKSISCFAGEILYIDIEDLAREGILNSCDISKYTFRKNVDYDAVRAFKMPLLKKAAQNFNRDDKKYNDFITKNAWWLDDFALFSSALSVYKTDSIKGLPDGIKYRLPADIEAFEQKYKSHIDFHKITQYIFYTQYSALKNYANKKGVMIIGDIPFYVSGDSVDVWVNPDDFKVGLDFTPTLVAGVPPDRFSDTGQLWGNPIYNFSNMRQNGYDWWSKRLAFCQQMYDVLRIDHFRAFARFYQIPQGSKTAVNGSWQMGESERFWDTVTAKIGNINIIAEDLGGEEDGEVIKLLKYTGFPNMKILQFGFDGRQDNVFLPQNYPYNCVCYTGTHDNDTTRGWYENADIKTVVIFDSFMHDTDIPPAHRLIRAASRSEAMLCIIPMQDLLNLDSTARMNIPGTPCGNWTWSLAESDINPDNAKLIKKLTKERN
ncbi:MAG: 4-alpha-glucanotransferase [Clostridia bacterium]|nr:4-alpha-glucanotransferase [Clostridia bacterium]